MDLNDKENLQHFQTQLSTDHVSEPLFKKRKTNPQLLLVSNEINNNPINISIDNKLLDSHFIDDNRYNLIKNKSTELSIQLEKITVLTNLAEQQLPKDQTKSINLIRECVSTLKSTLLSFNYNHDLNDNLSSNNNNLDNKEFKLECPFGCKITTKSNRKSDYDNIKLKHLLQHHSIFYPFFSLIDIIANNDFFYNVNNCWVITNYINKQMENINFQFDFLSKSNTCKINFIKKFKTELSNVQINNSIQKQNDLKELLENGIKKANSDFQRAEANKNNRELKDLIIELPIYLLLDYRNFTFSGNVKNNFLIEDIINYGFNNEHNNLLIKINSIFQLKGEDLDFAQNPTRDHLKILNHDHSSSGSVFVQSKLYIWLYKSRLNNSFKIDKDGNFMLSFGDFLTAIENVGKSRVLYGLKTNSIQNTRQEKRNLKNRLNLFEHVFLDKLNEFGSEALERLCIKTIGVSNDIENQSQGNGILSLNLELDEQVKAGPILLFLAYSIFLKKTIEHGGFQWQERDSLFKGKNIDVNDCDLTWCNKFNKLKIRTDNKISTELNADADAPTNKYFDFGIEFELKKKSILNDLSSLKCPVIKCTKTLTSGYGTEVYINHLINHRDEIIKKESIDASSCLFCGKAFGKTYNLLRHIREQHGGEKRKK